MKMRKGLLFLPFLLLLVGAFISCEEVEEAGKYDNWRERNEAFADSIKRLTGENYVATAKVVGESKAVGSFNELNGILVSNALYPSKFPSN